MRLIEFMIKTVFVTFCIAILLFLFLPRYKLVDENTKYNTVPGSTERDIEKAKEYLKDYQSREIGHGKK